MGYVLPVLERGKQVQKDSGTGQGSSKWQSWDSNMGLLTLGFNETVHAEYLHGMLQKLSLLIIISKAICHF